MSELSGSAFFDHPILNSPYEYPGRHWELDETGQPTQRVIDRLAKGAHQLVSDGPSYRARLAPRPSSTEAAMP